MGFLTAIVAFFGVLASILNPTIGGALFLLCAVTLRWLRRQDIVKTHLLPWYLGGKVVLYLIKSSASAE